jgi:putative ABC transport system permease protein
MRGRVGKNNNGGFINKLLVRVEGDNFEGITSAMEERWKKILPGSPMTVVFIEDHYKNNLYRSETRLSKIMNVFSALAIFIAGLGLFGLASYTIMLRTKELGIRKVLGASLSGLVMAVSGGFVRLVAISFVVAAPVSWWVMTNWLQNFAYSVSFNWFILTGSGIVAITVAMGTVMYHALEAVRVNPAQSLRTE